MRLLPILLALLALALMSVAAYAGNPWWRLGLYGSVAAWTLAALCTLWLLAGKAGAAGPTLQAAVALVSGACALAESRAMLLGALPSFPLDHLMISGASVGGLAAAIAAVPLGWGSLRRKELGPQVLAAAGIVCAVAGAAPWLRVLR